MSHNSALTWPRSTDEETEAEDLSRPPKARQGGAAERAVNSALTPGLQPLANWEVLVTTDCYLQVYTRSTLTSLCRCADTVSQVRRRNLPVPRSHGVGLALAFGAVAQPDKAGVRGGGRGGHFRAVRGREERGGRSATFWAGL